MIAKVKIWIILLLMLVLLSGCSLMSLDQLYYPPKRPEYHDNLQKLIDEAMKDLTYSAPVSGKNRQALQTADLDGDGVDEYLLFAKDDSENPLKILIFSQVASGYVLMDTIEGYGFAFDFVDFAQMDDREGLEIIVGRQVSEEIPRSVSVYRFASDFARQMLSTSYSNYSVCDLNADGVTELMVFHSGGSEQGKGVAVCYGYLDGELQRTHVAHLSRHVSQLQQVEVGKLEDGTPAIYAISEENESSICVDVFALSQNVLTNLTNGISISAIRNYQVYPADIDEDGVIEMPMPIPVASASEGESKEYVLKWYSLGLDGSNHEKAYTYHHYPDGWYLFLDAEMVPALAIEQFEDSCVFYCQDIQSGELTRIFSILVLTGSDREENAMLPGRTVLYKGDTTIYAVVLENQADSYGITAQRLRNDFRPIRQEWNTEESGD